MSDGDEHDGTPFKPVYDVLDDRLTHFDEDAAEALLTAVLANKLQGDPVWLILIGPPSAGKTLLLTPLEGIWDCRLLSNVTPNTFLSGAHSVAGGDPSLLNKLGDRPFVAVKDLSTILESHPYDRAELFSQLREIYDGHISKSFGTGITREWSGKLTLVMGMTGAIDQYDSLRSELGERFLRFRFNPPEDRHELAKQSASAAGHEDEIRGELHDAYVEALTAAADRLDDVTISDRSRSQLAALAVIAAQARTTVNRGLKPEPELPPRLMGQLLKFAQAQASLRGWDDMEDLSLLRRLTLDAVPEPRRGVLKDIGATICQKQEEDPSVKVGELNYMSTPTRYRIIDDLVRLDVLEKEDGEGAASEEGGRAADRYTFDDEFQEMLEKTGGFFSQNVGV